MIAFLNGVVAEVAADTAVVDVGGVGYQAFISTSTADRLPRVGEPVKLFTYMSVQESGVSLFGFLTKDELQMFKMLISVSGIGPKGGLSVLSVLRTDDLRFAILAGDAKAIARAPGIGKKTAERIVLELHDKLSAESVAALAADDDTADIALPASGAGAKDEAVQALMSLGYGSADALRAVRRALAEADGDGEPATEWLLKKAFSYLV